jgi:hypothetical protein
MHYLCCAFRVQPAPEVVAAESDYGYVESTDSSCIHGLDSTPVSGR